MSKGETTLLEDYALDPGKCMRSIRALVIADMDGKRLASRHYSHPAQSHLLRKEKPAILPHANNPLMEKFINDCAYYAQSQTYLDGLVDKQEEEKRKRKLEQALWRLSKSAKEEVFLVDGSVCLAAGYGDVRFYVVGDPDVNELMLADVMTCLLGMFRMLFGESLCKAGVMDNLHAAFLLLDEICQDGVVLETDPKLILDRLREGADKDLQDLTVTELIQMGQQRLRAMMDS